LTHLEVAYGEILEILDVLNHQIRRRRRRCGFRRERIMSLANEDGRQLVAKDRFHRGQKSGLVVDHNIVCRRIALLHMVEYFLLVHVDQNAPLDRGPYSGVLNLARLEHDVAVRQHDRRSQGAQVCYRFHGAWKQPAGEWIFEQELGHLQQLGVVVEPGSEVLHAAQVVG
jgi:hypothetical protein